MRRAAESDGEEEDAVEEIEAPRADDSKVKIQGTGAADMDDPLLSTPLTRYNAMLAILRNGATASSRAS